MKNNTEQFSPTDSTRITDFLKHCIKAKQKTATQTKTRNSFVVLLVT